MDAVCGAIAKSIDLQGRLAEQDGIRGRLTTLTPRELDLLRLIVAGLPNKGIAADLHISIKTVANHRANLMAKTQALNAADLARMVTGSFPPSESAQIEYKAPSIPPGSISMMNMKWLR